MSDEVRNLFISHIHEDDERLTALKELLAKHGYEVRDSSINSDKPNDAKNKDYIKREILAPQIQWAKVLVVLVSPGTHESEWVDWEIEHAHEQGMRVVGVWDWGASDADLPENLKKYGSSTVTWQGQLIIDAINGKDEWDNADGSPRAEADIPRYHC